MTGRATGKFDISKRTGMRFQLEEKDEPTVPHEVVKMNVLEGIPMVKAWRVHLNLTQAEVAKRAGITQAALSQIEKPGGKPHKDTLKKLAKALGLAPGQME